MPGEFLCGCGRKVSVPDGGPARCPGCGLEYADATDLTPELWRADPTAALALSSADGATKKPGPPLVGEPLWAPPTVTMDFYEKLANAPRRAPRRRGRKRIGWALIGGAFLAAAAAIYHFQLDAGLLHLGSLACVGAGLVYLFKAMLGNDR